MTDKLTPQEAWEAEQDAYLDDGVGQPPSRDPAGAITKALFVLFGAVVLAVIIASIAQ